jgi:hypothetical protein
MPIVLLIERTAQPFRREGALLKHEFQMINDRPIEEGEYSTASRSAAHTVSQKAERDERCGKGSDVSEETIT